MQNKIINNNNNNNKVKCSQRVNPTMDYMADEKNSVKSF